VVPAALVIAIQQMKEEPKEIILFFHLFNLQAVEPVVEITSTISPVVEVEDPAAGAAVRMLETVR
jgi:hypothetical protein